MLVELDRHQLGDMIEVVATNVAENNFYEYNIRNVLIKYKRDNKNKYCTSLLR